MESGNFWKIDFSRNIIKTLIKVKAKLRKIYITYSNMSTMKWNIAMVNGFFYPYIGGTEKHMYELGRRFAKNNTNRHTPSHIEAYIINCLV